MSEKPVTPASEPEDFPAPSAELVLFRVMIESYLATAHLKPKARAKAGLRIAAEILASEESVATLLPFRPASQHAAVFKARRQAVAILRQWLPLFIARLPRD